MKPIGILSALALTAALLPGCTQQASDPQSQPSGSTPAASGSSAGASSQETGVPVDMDLLAQRYVDVSALPVLDLDVEERVQFDDRTLILEDGIDNELEHLVY